MSPQTRNPVLKIYIPVILPPKILKLHYLIVGLLSGICELAYFKSKIENQNGSLILPLIANGTLSTNSLVLSIWYRFCYIFLLMHFDFSATFTVSSHFAITTVGKMKKSSVKFPSFSMWPSFSWFSLVASTFANTSIRSCLPFTCTGQNNMRKCVLTSQHLSAPFLSNKFWKIFQIF